jgi:acyl-CoA thioesterase FadM
MNSSTTVEATVLTGRPSFEGANIRTWIGFKHFMYLVENAVHEWLRGQGTGARDLFLEYGHGFEIVDCSVQLPAVLEIDDEVTAAVTESRPGRLVVHLAVERDGRPVTVLRGKVTVALVPESAAATHRPVPAALAGLPDAGLDAPVRRTLAPGETPESVLTAEPGAFLWSWRAPYFYCHYSDRVQHSGFVRALEEVVDRFLHDRGISVGRLLTERSWIPVVSRARVRLVGDARMEETVHTVFTVTDILRGVMFDGTMTCYVRRGDELLTVAKAQILHGYAIAAGPGAGGLAELDAPTVAALRGLPS